MGDRPNVVLVTVDSLRADHCGCYGYRKDVTPTLDEMAADGVRFENAIAPGPATPSSMPGMFTGNTAYHHREHDNPMAQVADHMATMRAVPEVLSRRGYTTIGYTPNPFTSRECGFDAGFDEFEDFFSSEASGGVRSRIISRWKDRKFVGGLRFLINMLGVGDVSTSWSEYYDELVERVAAADDPFFLWVFLLEPHWPYLPPRAYRDGVSRTQLYRCNWITSNLSGVEPDEADVDDLLTLYDGTVRSVDDFLAALRSDLGDREPVIVFTADHGEAFCEHGVHGHGPHLYEEHIRVPLVVGNVDDHRTVTESISLAEMPSLLDDIVSSGDTDWSRHTDSAVISRANEKTALRTARWKYLSDESGALFDLREDATESNPLAPDDPEPFERLASVDEHRNIEGWAIARSAERLAREAEV